jgi:hypothetical protein
MAMRHDRHDRRIRQRFTIDETAGRIGFGVRLETGGNLGTVTFARIARNMLRTLCRRRSLLALLFLAVVCALLAWITRLNTIAHDLFHEMATARAALESGQFPLTDRFAYTSHAGPCVHHEWGLGLILYGLCVATRWDAAGLMLFRWTLIAWTLFASWRSAQRRGGRAVAFAFGVLLVLPLLWVGLGTVRAQLLTLALLSTQLWLQSFDSSPDGGDRPSSGPRRGWIVPLLGCWFVWVNCHAGFIVGWGIAGFHALECLLLDPAWSRADRISRRSLGALVGRNWQRWGLVLAGAAMLGLTPYGGLYPTYLFAAIQMPRPEIREWLPLWHTYQPVLSITAWLAMLGLALASAFDLGWWKRQPQRLFGLLAITACAYLSLKHIRHGSLFAIVWLSIAPAWISLTAPWRISEAAWWRSRRRWAPWAVVSAAACLGWFISQQGYRPILPTARTPLGAAAYPVGAVNYLRDSDFHGNVLTAMPWGSYTLWHLADRVRVSFDGRYEVAYPPQTLERHRDFYRAAPGWREWLESTSTDVVMTSCDDPVAALLPDAGWQPIYRDRGFILFAPTDRAATIPAPAAIEQPMAAPLVF